MLTDWGLKQSQIKLVAVLGSRHGVEHLGREFPDVEVGLPLPQNGNQADDVRIYIGAVDEELTEKGYISPGLGDAVCDDDFGMCLRLTTLARGIDYSAHTTNEYT